MIVGQKANEIDAFIKNVLYLAKENDNTISQLEKHCGLSIGYFSRRNKSKTISLGTALVVSDYLGRSLTELLNPKLRHDLEAQRIQEKQNLVAEKRLNVLYNEGEEETKIENTQNRNQLINHMNQSENDTLNDLKLNSRSKAFAQERMMLMKNKQ